MGRNPFGSVLWVSACLHNLDDVIWELEKEIRVIIPDLQGHGFSESSEGKQSLAW